jgi:H+/Cl- antiporter ClcA
MQPVAQAMKASQLASWLTLTIVTVLIGVSAGLGGMSLGLLLHAVQHIAYGYGLHAGAASESFFEGVSASSPLRRFLALSACSLVAGGGWWAVYRYGSSLVSIRKAVADNGERMPFFTTIAHDLLQIVTVGLGSPLGREVAPRELGAVLATRICERAKLPPSTARTLIACGAGAGLAAVYNVPLAGALFTLEVLLSTFRPSAMIPALATSVLATLVARIGLGNARQYFIPDLSVSRSLILWSILIGPLLGFVAYWFVRLTEAARKHAPRDWKILLWCGAVFPGIGLLSISFPQLLGNGKGLAQLCFDPGLTIAISLILLALKTFVTVAALRAGAEGGLLTPGFTIGALLGTIGGILWSYALSGTPVAAFAIVGAVAFLATSMKMPLTAIALGAEFTRVGHDFLVPILLAVAGSFAVGYACSRSTRKAAQAILVAR